MNNTFKLISASVGDSITILLGLAAAYAAYRIFLLRRKKEGETRKTTD